MKVILWTAVGLLVFVAAVRYLERASLYYPVRQMMFTPMDVNLDYEEVYLRAEDDVKIHAWHIPAREAEYTVLFSHGNAGNISHRLDKISSFNDIGLNVFIFDYRGYGKSGGFPSEQGLYRDAYASYHHLIDEMNVAPENIILYGESLGGAVSVELASTRLVGGLITESNFTSVKEMARLVFPFVPHVLLASRFDSLSKIGDVEAPKLIIHSIDDEIVPFSQGEKLFQAASEPKTFLKLRGGHNTAFMDSRGEYERGIRAFVDELRQ